MDYTNGIVGATWRFAAIIAAVFICVYGVLHGREVKTVRYSANIGISSGNQASECGADLVLCGHTHQGQLFPINFFTKWAYGAERFWGHHQLGKTHIIVSAGCSVFQLPVRVATNNEVVVVDLSF